MQKSFGTLTTRTHHKELIKTRMNNTSFAIDYIFRDLSSKLVNMTVADSDYRIALENLRKLTSELQVKRLRYKTKSTCKYFTL